jgi:hypothetical protein
MFDTQSLLKSLRDADIPDDHKNAFLLMATLDGGVKGIFTTKINSVWQIDSIVTVSRTNNDRPIKVEGGVQVKATW